MTRRVTTLCSTETGRPDPAVDRISSTYFVSEQLACVPVA
jgi:hypothetical protein